jgi:hypothetical protein
MPPPIEIKRHYSVLSEKERNELVSAVADMLVAFIKSRTGGRATLAERRSVETKPVTP